MADKTYRGTFAKAVKEIGLQFEILSVLIIPQDSWLRQKDG